MVVITTVQISGIVKNAKEEMGENTVEISQCRLEYTLVLMTLHAINLHSLIPYGFLLQLNDVKCLPIRIERGHWSVDLKFSGTIQV